MSGKQLDSKNTLRRRIAVHLGHLHFLRPSLFLASINARKHVFHFRVFFSFCTYLCQVLRCMYLTTNAHLLCVYNFMYAPVFLLSTTRSTDLTG